MKDLVSDCQCYVEGIGRWVLLSVGNVGVLLSDLLPRAEPRLRWTPTWTLPWTLHSLETSDENCDRWA